VAPSTLSAAALRAREDELARLDANILALSIIDSP
jgi:hypothetical protein